MMQKFLLIILGLAIIGGGVYFLSKGPSEENTERETASTSGTVGDLLTMGGNMRCEIDITGDSFSSSGQVFISGRDVRADLETNIEGQRIISSIIQKGGFIYSWASVVPQGYRFKVEESGESNFDVTTPLNYECSPWLTVDPTRFELPDNIEFLDGDSLNLNQAS